MDAAQDIVVRQVEQTIVELETEHGGNGVCVHHTALAKGVALSLKLLVPLYRNAENKSTAKDIEELLRKRARETVVAWMTIIPAPVLLVIYAIAKKEGWL